MPATLESITDRLARIEEMLAIRPVTRASYTPKEFAKLVGRSYRWTVDRCAARTIRTVSRTRPYLIPASEVERFSTGQRAVAEA